MQHFTVVAVMVVILALGGFFLLVSNRGGTVEVPSWVSHMHFATTSETTISNMQTSETVGTKTKSLVSVTPGVERWYSNSTLKFSFQLPDGFTAPEIDTGVPGTYGVWVHNDTGAQLVVMVNPIAAGSSISAAGIRDNLPGVTVRDVQDTVIGTLVHAVRFKNNAKEWDGDGVSVWAAYNGYVYQISTARTNEELLDFVTSHWFFTPPQPSRK